MTALREEDDRAELAAFRAGWDYGCDHMEPPVGPPGVPATVEAAYRDWKGLKPKPKQVWCAGCGCEMKLRTSKFGTFWGCTGYPVCRHTRPV